MEACTPTSRCLICRRVTLEYPPIDSETLVSNASLLQDFLNCFHINVLDTEVNDLSTACQFCPTCEKFLAEWSSIQTQMTQLTRRAAQLEATLSALLLSAPRIQEQNHDEYVTEIINTRIQNSQDVELPLLLQQTVDDIRNELRKKYFVNVMVEKIELPCTPSKSNSEESDSLSGCCDKDDEPMDDCRGDDNSDAEYLPSDHQTDDEETSDQITVMRIKTEEEANSENSDGHDSLKLKEMKVRISKTQAKVGRKSRTDHGPKRKRRRRSPSNQVIPDGPNRFKFKGMSFQQNEEDQTYTCDTCGFKSLPSKMSSIRVHLHKHLPKSGVEKEKRKQRQTVLIPDGPNKFKYNGHGLEFNDEDQCYNCGACDFKGTTSSFRSVLIHIRQIHYTEEDKVKFTAVKTSDTEWLYGGMYKIVAVGEKVKCVSCGAVKSHMSDIIRHLRSQHVDMECHQEEVPLPVTDTPSLNDSTPTEGVYLSVPYIFNPVNNKYTCGICQIQVLNRGNLGRHIRERHTDAALKVICEICGKGLVNQEAYKKHVKKHQTEPKNCPTCDKQFRDDRSFKRHLKVHAFGDAAKKYQCEYCGKKFLLPAQCRTHVMIHTGEMPLKCQVCGDKFRYYSLLANHRQSAHGFERKVRNLTRINE